MEIHSSAVIVIIIITIFILIIYAISLIYNENKDLKTKLNTLYTSIDNIETNMNGLFSSLTKHDLDTNLDLDEDLDEDIDEDLEEDFEEEDFEEEDLEEEKLIELFSQSKNELKKHENKIYEIHDIEEVDETNQEFKPELEIDEIQLEVNKDTFCEKILTNGKRKGEECKRKTTENSVFCGLHLA